MYVGCPVCGIHMQEEWWGMEGKGKEGGGGRKREILIYLHNPVVNLITVSSSAACMLL